MRRPEFMWPTLAFCLILASLLYVVVILDAAAKDIVKQEMHEEQFRRMVELHLSEDKGYAEGYNNGFVDGLREDK